MSSRRCIDVAGKKGSACIQLKWLSISYSLFCLNTARSVSGSGSPSVHRPGPRDCRKLDGTEQGKFLSCSFIQDGNRCAVEEVVMLRKRKEPKAKKSVLETVMR